MKAALYARVSTVAQGAEDKASIPEQVRRIEQYCQTKYYTIADRYIDIGYSGAKKNRPEFLRMLADAKQGKFDVVVCWKADRLSRGMYPAAALMEVIEPLDITLEAVEERLDMNYFAMLAVVGKMEIDNFAARTKLGREDRAKNKQLHPGGHYIDYGYAIKDGKIVVAEKEAAWIRDLFLWVGNGNSSRSWVKYANEHGFVTRHSAQGVLPQQVSIWLRNPIYKGEYQWNKSTIKSGKRKKLPETEHITIKCPPIVSAELWDRVQERLKLNKKYSRGNARHFFLLRGLLRCRECGKSFVGGTSGSYRYYECYGTLNYPHHHQCRQPHRIKANQLEKSCWNEIVSQVTSLVSKQDVVGYLLNEADVYTARLDGELEKERGAVENCDWQRQLIARRERQGYLSPKEADLQYRAIREEQERYQEEIKKLEQMKSDGSNWQQIEELMARVDWLHNQFNWKDFSSAPDDQKRRLLEEVVDRIVVDGNNAVEVRLKLPSPQLAEAVASLSMHHTTCSITRL